MPVPPGSPSPSPSPRTTPRASGRHVLAAGLAVVAGLLLIWAPTTALASAASPGGQGAEAPRRASGARTMATPDDAEAEFVADINQLRTSKGLQPLVIDVELTQQARIWAETMNQAGKIFHSSDMSAGISSRWLKLGENVGVGGAVAALFQAFVDSPAHYENLVDPLFTHLGVGVVISADGSRMFTAHRFMSLAPETPPADPAAPTSSSVAPPAYPGAPAVPSTLPSATTTTVAPTTTLVSPTTVPAAPKPKLGPVDRVAALIDSGS